MSEQPDELPTRWEVELEFVQSLANIQYVNFLAQNDYFNDPAFINYLEYLNYWREPKYAKHLVYPNCLHILTLLQNQEFRKQITNPELMNSLMNDMVKKWQGVDEINSIHPEAKDGKELSQDGQSASQSETTKAPQIKEESAMEVDEQIKQDKSDGEQSASAKETETVKT